MTDSCRANTALITKERIEIKRRRQRCQNHKAKDRDYSHYAFSYVDYKGTEIYHCIECRVLDDKEYERLCRIVANQKKQREDADKIYWIKAKEKQAERERSIKEDLWDHVVRKELLKGIKNSYFIEIPKELLQLKRASMKLQRLIIQKKKETCKMCIAVPKALHKQVKLKALNQDTTLTELVIHALNNKVRSSK